MTFFHKHEDIIIFGAEGLAKDTYSLILENNDNIKSVFGCKFNIIGFVDEFNYNRELFELPVKNNINEFDKKSYVIIAFGSPKGKKNTKLKLDNEVQYVNIVNADTYINKTVDLGIGNIIMNNVSISGNVRIGNHICIYYQSCMSHDCTIGDYSTICPGVTVCGNVNIGEGCFIGAGTVIKEKINIVDNVIIGAGSLVLKDIKEEGVYYGHPIRNG
jgi:sugar O-acyltransferase (sialic acid O-acetyltransferase NeuD family)